MDYSKWPAYIQKRYALQKIELGPGSECSWKPKVGEEKITADRVVDWIYTVLSTLDSKASALMRLNGVLIAAAAFLLGLFGRQGTSILATTHWDALLIMGCALLSATSIGFCLFVVNVSWSFLGRMQAASDGTVTCSDELLWLERARSFRQRMYRVAWWISFIASLAFILEFTSQAYHVLFGGNLLGTCS
jgi:hypothetical protein